MKFTNRRNADSDERNVARIAPLMVQYEPSTTCEDLRSRVKRTCDPLGAPGHRDAEVGALAAAVDAAHDSPFDPNGSPTDALLQTRLVEGCQREADLRALAMDAEARAAAADLTLAEVPPPSLIGWWIAAVLALAMSGAAAYAFAALATDTIFAFNTRGTFALFVADDRLADQAAYHAAFLRMTVFGGCLALIHAGPVVIGRKPRWWFEMLLLLLDACVAAGLVVMRWPSTKGQWSMPSLGLGLQELGLMCLLGVACHVAGRHAEVIRTAHEIYRAARHRARTLRAAHERLVTAVEVAVGEVTLAADAVRAREANTWRNNALRAQAINMGDAEFTAGTSETAVELSTGRAEQVQVVASARPLPPPTHQSTSAPQARRK